MESGAAGPTSTSNLAHLVHNLSSLLPPSAYNVFFLNSLLREKNREFFPAQNFSPPKPAWIQPIHDRSGNYQGNNREFFRRASPLPLASLPFPISDSRFHLT